MLIPLLGVHCRSNATTAVDRKCLREASMKVEVADEETVEVWMPDNCGLAPCNFSSFALDPNDDVFLAKTLSAAAGVRAR